MKAKCDWNSYFDFSTISDNNISTLEHVDLHYFLPTSLFYIYEIVLTQLHYESTTTV